MFSSYRSIIAAAGSSFRVNAVDFNGTTNYLNRGARFTGDSNSSTGILSLWVRFDSFATAPILFIPNQTGTSPVRLIFSSTSKQRLRLEDNSGNIVVMDTSNLSTNTWYNILASWNVAFTSGSRLLHLYVNDVSDKTIMADYGASYTLPYTAVTDWFVGVNSNTTDNFLDGCLAELYFAPGQYLDFSVSSNRRKFISAGGKPVDLGATGSLPTGTSPILYIKNNATAYGTNSGTGGNMTTHGTFNNCATSPSS